MAVSSSRGNIDAGQVFQSFLGEIVILSLKVLNSDATVNNFVESSSLQIVRGADATIKLRLVQPERSNLRYIPASGATFSISFLKSDGTSLVKVPTQPIADDKSILQVVLTDTETQTLISQGLNVEINEGSDKNFAVLQQGLQMQTLNSDC